MPVPALNAIDLQLLLQLGERLRLLRKAEGITGVDLASRIGISRSTLRAVEAGDPRPSLGMYLRVMAALGVGGDLAVLASNPLRQTPNESAAACTGRASSVNLVTVKADVSRHQVQDLQSLALHEAAVAAVRRDPERLAHARSKVTEWLKSKPTSRSTELWREWEEILKHRSWRKVLGRSQRAQQLRQASPLTIVLKDEERRSVLRDVVALKAGVSLGTSGGGKQ